jgi:hypothetical protein
MLKSKLTIFAVIICTGALLVGQLVPLNVFTTQVAAAATALPLPTDPVFFDDYNKPYEINGSLDFTPPTDVSNTTDYAIYLLDSQGVKLQHLGDVNKKKEQESIAFRKSMGLSSTNYSFRISYLTIPEAAAKFGIYPKNAEGENETGVYLSIADQPRHTLSNLVFTDKNHLKDEVAADLKWKAIQDERLISGYKIYYKKNGEIKELSSNSVDVVKGKSEYIYSLPQGALPIETTDLLVYSISEDGKKSAGVITKAYDDISEGLIAQLTPSNTLPQPKISNIVDEDSVQGTIKGTVSFDVVDYQYNANDSSSKASALSYAVYFLDANKQKLKGIVKIPKEKTSRGFIIASSYFVKIPEGTVIPKDTASIGVFAQMDASEGDLFGEKTFWDSSLINYQPTNLKFTDMDPLPQSVKAKVSWQAADNEEPIYGYAIYLDSINRLDNKPYTIIEKGKKEFEFIFPDGALKHRGHRIYVLPVDEKGNIKLTTDSTIPTNVTMSDSTTAQKATFEVVGLSLNQFNTIEDTDARPGVIGGKVFFEKPEKVAAIEIFYVDMMNRKRDSIVELDCTGSACEEEMYEIQNGTAIADGAAFIGIRARMKDNTYRPLKAIAVKDKSSDHVVTFPDLPNEFTGKKEIEYMAAMNLIKGFSDGSFGPDKGVTRAEFATMLVKAFHLTSKDNGKTNFSDVSTSDWFGNAVAAAVDHKLLSGYEDGTFRPNKLINRSEMAVMVFGAHNMVYTSYHSMKYVEYQDNYDIPKWAQNAVSFVKYNGFAPKVKKFEPTKPVSRAEAAVMLYRLLEYYQIVDVIK